jgi:hypothetical protein
VIAASLSVCTLSWAAAALPPAADVALEVIGRPVPEAVAEFHLWDAG